jgi:DNA helicase II / ATP-dependent DNA helicase PcrA
MGSRTGFGGGRGRGFGRGFEGEGWDAFGWEDEDKDGMEGEMNQDLPRFVKGERVNHPTFGSGTVLEASGFGSDLKVTVLFDSVGRKKLLARYAGLEKDYL